MPIQAPQWTDYLNCPVCCREFGAPPRSPISLSCGHTLCRHCLKHLHRKQCPFDQTLIEVDTEELVVNTALLQLAGHTPPTEPYHPPSIQTLPDNDRQAYDCIVKCMEHLAVYLKFCGNANNTMAGSRLSRPMQRKLVMLLQCAITDGEGRGRAARAARSLGERTVTELILQHQNPQQLSANLWAAVRARGCQFLGPAMQEEVLKLVLLALEDGSALSRKVLVMFVVQRLEPHFPQASKTSIGHVVQLLYRASCFKVSKRECDSSLMQLKEEFRTYETLRREHDAQIVQIATEAGLRIAPDQWSALLYGDTAHKSHMQSIIDKLQTPQSFAQSVQELFIALQRTGDPAQLNVMSMHLDRLANIDPSPDAPCPSWQQLAEVITSLKEVVAGLIHYLQQQVLGRDSNHNQKHNANESFNLDNTANQVSPQTGTTPTHTKYKVAMCRDAASRSFCPRGSSCTFAHSDEELERFREYVAEMSGEHSFVNSITGQTVAMPPQFPAYVVPQPRHTLEHNYSRPHSSQAQQGLASAEIRDNQFYSSGQSPQNYAVSQTSVIIRHSLPNSILIPAGTAHIYYRFYNRLSDDHRGSGPYTTDIRPTTYVQNSSLPGPNVQSQDNVVQRNDVFNPVPPLPEFRMNRPQNYTNLLSSGSDTVWAPNPGEIYNFGEMAFTLPPPAENFSQRSTILPHTSRRASPVNGTGPISLGSSSARNGFNNFNNDPRNGILNVNGAQVLNRMALGMDRVYLERSSLADRLEQSGSYEDTGLDYEQLEAGLQALERRIDTEFENTD